MKNKNSNSDSWQDRVITKSQVMEQDAIKHIVTAGAKSPEEAEALYAATRADKRADRLARKSKVVFDVGSEPSKDVAVGTPTTTPDASEAIAIVGEATSQEASVPVMSPSSVQEGNVPIWVQAEPKDGNFDPAWKEPGVKYGDTPTGIPQPEIPSKVTTPEIPTASSETMLETAKEMPVTTEDVARLMDAVEEARVFYAEVLAIDKREQSLFSKVTALFKNVKRVPDPAIERAKSVYQEQLLKLQEAELERIKQSGLKGQELKEALAEGLRYFKLNEVQELYEAQNKMRLQVMERTKMGRLSQKIENFFRAYNKLSFAKKMTVAGGWFGAAVATGGASVFFSRTFAGAAMATGLNAATDSWVERKRVEQLDREMKAMDEMEDVSFYYERQGGKVQLQNNTEDDEEGSLQDLVEADAVAHALEEGGAVVTPEEMEVYAAYGRDEKGNWLKKSEQTTAPSEARPEELYERFQLFTEKIIKETPDLVERWKTNDKRRRMAIRVAGFASAFLMGKIAGAALETEAGKEGSAWMREKMTAGISWLAEYFEGGGNAAEQPLKGPVIFDESVTASKQTGTQVTVSAPETQVSVESGLKKFPGEPPVSEFAQEMMAPQGRTPALDEIANVRTTLAEKFQVDEATSKLAQEMLTPEGSTPTLDAIVTEKTSEAAAPETVAPGAISSKIENILAHTAVKGDTLWDDSIKMAKGLGVEAGNEKAFAAKVEGAIREAIEKDQTLLSKMGFSETEFTRSDGEHLWLVEGKPVDYSSILTQEKLQEIVNGLGEAGKVPGASPEGIGVKPELSVAPETPSVSTSEVSGKGGVAEVRPTFDGMDASGESVVANEASPRDSGKILEMRTVAQAPAPPLEAADIAALKASLSAEAAANMPATPPVSGTPKIGAETILAAKGSGVTGGGARFIDAATESAGSKKAPAGFVRVGAEILTPEKLVEQYSAEKFDANQYISSLSPAEYEASRLKYNNLVRKVMVLQPGEVSPADFEQSERFRAYERAGMVGVFPAQSGNMKMSDIMEKFSKMEKGELVAFGFSLEKNDLHSTHIKHLGRFVRENIRLFGVVGTPGKEERLAEYFARMLAISEKAPHLIVRSPRIM